METLLRKFHRCEFTEVVRMEVFPERDGNLNREVRGLSREIAVRMEVFPERDGNFMITRVRKLALSILSEWRSSLKGMETLCL